MPKPRPLRNLPPQPEFSRDLQRAIDVCDYLGYCLDDLSNCNQVLKRSDPELVRLEHEVDKHYRYYRNLSRITAEREGITLPWDDDK